MDYAREKKVIWSKSRILIVLACVAVLLHSLRGLSVVYQENALSKPSVKWLKWLSQDINNEKKGEHLVLSDSICHRMKIQEVLQLLVDHPQLVHGYRKIILHLGTNNIFSRDPVTRKKNFSRFSADDIKQLFIKLSDKIHLTNPNCTLFVSAILPRPRDHVITQNKIAEVNSFLEATFGRRYIASDRHFMDEKSQVTTNSTIKILDQYFHPDGLHLTEKGKDLLSDIFRNIIST